MLAAIVLDQVNQGGSSKNMLCTEIITRTWNGVTKIEHGTKGYVNGKSLHITIQLIKMGGGETMQQKMDACCLWPQIHS